MSDARFTRKYCTDCAHYLPRLPPTRSVAECYAIDGKIEDPYAMRLPGSDCGPEAKLFESGLRAA